MKALGIDLWVLFCTPDQVMCGFVSEIHVHILVSLSLNFHYIMTFWTVKITSRKPMAVKYKYSILLRLKGCIIYNALEVSIADLDKGRMSQKIPSKKMNG